MYTDTSKLFSIITNTANLHEKFFTYSSTSLRRILGRLRSPKCIYVNKTLACVFLASSSIRRPNYHALHWVKVTKK